MKVVQSVQIPPESTKFKFFVCLLWVIVGVFLWFWDIFELNIEEAARKGKAKEKRKEKKLQLITFDRRLLTFSWSPMSSAWSVSITIWNLSFIHLGFCGFMEI